MFNLNNLIVNLFKHKNIIIFREHLLVSAFVLSYHGRNFYAEKMRTMMFCFSKKKKSTKNNNNDFVPKNKDFILKYSKSFGYIKSIKVIIQF